MPTQEEPQAREERFTVEQNQTVTLPDGSTRDLKKGEQLPLSEAIQLGLIGAAEDEAESTEEKADG